MTKLTFVKSVSFERRCRLIQPKVFISDLFNAEFSPESAAVVILDLA